MRMWTFVFWLAVRVQARLAARLSLRGGCGSTIVPASFRQSGDVALQTALSVTTSERFERVADDSGVTVYRHAEDRDVLKATATIDAPLEAVVRVLKNSSRSSEYNEHCNELKEIASFDDESQITWSSTAAIGPFKARDFLTAVHWRAVDQDGDGVDETVALVNHAVDDYAGAPERDDDKYVRSEVRLGCQLLRRSAEDPSKTEVTLVSAVDCGGAADTPVGQAVARKMAETGPVTFFKALEASARRDLAQASPTRSRAPRWLRFIAFDEVHQAKTPAGPPPPPRRVWAGDSPW